MRSCDQEPGGEGTGVKGVKVMDRQNGRETHSLVSVFGCACRELSGMLSERVQIFFLVFKLCQSLAQSVGAAPSGNAQQPQRQLLRAGAGSCSLSSPLRDKVCASGDKAALGAGMRAAAAPLQVMWGAAAEGSAGGLHLSTTPWDLAGMLPGAASLEGEPGGAQSEWTEGKNGKGIREKAVVPLKKHSGCPEGQVGGFLF